MNAISEATKNLKIKKSFLWVKREEGCLDLDETLEGMLRRWEAAKFRLYGGATRDVFSDSAMPIDDEMSEMPDGCSYPRDDYRCRPLALSLTSHQFAYPRITREQARASEYDETAMRPDARHLLNALVDDKIPRDTIPLSGVLRNNEWSTRELRHWDNFLDRRRDDFYGPKFSGGNGVGDDATARQKSEFKFDRTDSTDGGRVIRTPRAIRYDADPASAAWESGCYYGTDDYGPPNGGYFFRNANGSEYNRRALVKGGDFFDSVSRHFCCGDASAATTNEHDITFEYSYFEDNNDPARRSKSGEAQPGKGYTVEPEYSLVESGASPYNVRCLDPLQQDVFTATIGLPYVDDRVAYAGESVESITLDGCVYFGEGDVDERVGEVEEEEELAGTDAKNRLTFGDFDLTEIYDVVEGNADDVKINNDVIEYTESLLLSYVIFVHAIISSACHEQQAELMIRKKETRRCSTTPRDSFQKLHNRLHSDCLKHIWYLTLPCPSLRGLQERHQLYKLPRPCRLAPGPMTHRQRYRHRKRLLNVKKIVESTCGVEVGPTNSTAFACFTDAALSKNLPDQKSRNLPGFLYDNSTPFAYRSLANPPSQSDGHTWSAFSNKYPLDADISRDDEFPNTDDTRETTFSRAAKDHIIKMLGIQTTATQINRDDDRKRLEKTDESVSAVASQASDRAPIKNRSVVVNSNGGDLSDVINSYVDETSAQNRRRFSSSAAALCRDEFKRKILDSLRFGNDDRLDSLRCGGCNSDKLEKRKSKKLPLEFAESKNNSEGNEGVEIDTGDCTSSNEVPMKDCYNSKDFNVLAGKFNSETFSKNCHNAKDLVKKNTANPELFVKGGLGRNEAKFSVYERRPVVGGNFLSATTEDVQIASDNISEIRNGATKAAATKCTATDKFDFKRFWNFEKNDEYKSVVANKNFQKLEDIESDIFSTHRNLENDEKNPAEISSKNYCDNKVIDECNLKIKSNLNIKAKQFFPSTASYIKNLNSNIKATNLDSKIDSSKYSDLKPNQTISSYLKFSQIELKDTKEALLSKECKDYKIKIETETTINSEMTSSDNPALKSANIYYYQNVPSNANFGLYLANYVNIKPAVSTLNQNYPLYVNNYMQANQLVTSSKIDACTISESFNVNLASPSCSMSQSFNVNLAPPALSMSKSFNVNLAPTTSSLSQSFNVNLTPPTYSMSQSFNVSLTPANFFQPHFPPPNFVQPSAFGQIGNVNLLFGAQNYLYRPATPLFVPCYPTPLIQTVQPKDQLKAASHQLYSETGSTRLQKNNSSIQLNADTEKTHINRNSKNIDFVSHKTPDDYGQSSNSRFFSNSFRSNLRSSNSAPISTYNPNAIREIAVVKNEKPIGANAGNYRSQSDYNLSGDNATSNNGSQNANSDAKLASKYKAKEQIKPNASKKPASTSEKFRHISSLNEIFAKIENKGNRKFRNKNKRNKGCKDGAVYAANQNNKVFYNSSLDKGSQLFGMEPSIRHKYVQEQIDKIKNLENLRRCKSDVVKDNDEDGCWSSYFSDKIDKIFEKNCGDSLEIRMQRSGGKWRAESPSSIKEKDLFYRADNSPVKLEKDKNKLEDKYASEKFEIKIMKSGSICDQNEESALDANSKAVCSSLADQKSTSNQTNFSSVGDSTSEQEVSKKRDTTKKTDETSRSRLAQLWMDKNENDDNKVEEFSVTLQDLLVNISSEKAKNLRSINEDKDFNKNDLFYSRSNKGLFIDENHCKTNCKINDKSQEPLLDDLSKNISQQNDKSKSIISPFKSLDQKANKVNTKMDISSYSSHSVSQSIPSLPNPKFISLPSTQFAINASVATSFCKQSVSQSILSSTTNRFTSFPATQLSISASTPSLDQYFGVASASFFPIFGTVSNSASQSSWITDLQCNLSTGQEILSTHSEESKYHMQSFQSTLEQKFSKTLPSNTPNITRNIRQHFKTNI